MFASSDGNSISGLWFADQKNIPVNSSFSCEKLEIFFQLEQWLTVYFSGKDPEFTPPLSLESSMFRKSVWEALLSIPFGSTVSYGELARRVNSGKNEPQKSARAIGGAVAHNQILLIIPCHRVIASNGSLTGYAGGIDRKRKLLELEKENTDDCCRFILN
jgi:methylated-DNA-[protein]-cysteine S-methyltransferase